MPPTSTTVRWTTPRRPTSPQNSSPGASRTSKPEPSSTPSTTSFRSIWTTCARRKEELVSKTLAAVKDRLTKEINHWDHRAEQEKAREVAGGKPTLNSAKFRERANNLEARLKKRLEELEQERRLAPLPPVAIGGALVVPAGLIARLGGEPPERVADHARETARVEKLAMDAVMAAERALGFEPRDVGSENRGYDIESRDPKTGKLRFIEVKGRVEGAATVCVTKNEILTALNKPEDFILAIVEVDGDSVTPRIAALSARARLRGYER